LHVDAMQHETAVESSRWRCMS